MEPKRFAKPAAVLLILLTINTAAAAAEKTYSFGVLNQRNAVLTAQYWNPILDYVSKKSGVILKLKIGKTIQETDDMTARGDLDFVFSNHIFIPRMSGAGYRVLAWPSGESIQGQIVVLQNMPFRSLEDLEGRDVAFPSKAAFVAYAVTMDAIIQKGIHVTPVLAGNQEGAMGQLKAGRVAAASVNSQVMQEYAIREGIEYRVLWSSTAFAAIPIAANRRVSKDKADAIRTALISMASDPEGLKILAASAALIRQKPPLGFTASDDNDYESQREFYKATVLKGF